MTADQPRDIAHLQLVFLLDPRVFERARRLEFALRHLRAGSSPCAVRLMLRQQFNMPQPSAWRVVDMALDLEGPA